MLSNNRLLPAALGSFDPAPLWRVLKQMHNTYAEPLELNIMLQPGYSPKWRWVIRTKRGGLAFV
jgi:hypothetical protein